jgi:hypothetical protein
MKHACTSSFSNIRNVSSVFQVFSRPFAQIVHFVTLTEKIRSSALQDWWTHPDTINLELTPSRIGVSMKRSRHSWPRMSSLKLQRQLRMLSNDMKCPHGDLFQLFSCFDRPGHMQLFKTRIMTSYISSYIIQHIILLHYAVLDLMFIMRNHHDLILVWYH